MVEIVTGSGAEGSEQQQISKATKFNALVEVVREASGCSSNIKEYGLIRQSTVLAREFLEDPGIYTPDPEIINTFGRLEEENHILAWAVISALRRGERQVKRDIKVNIREILGLRVGRGPLYLNGSPNN